MANHRWKSLTLALLAVLGLAFLFRPQTVFYEPASKRSQCKNNLKQFGLALRLYHERYGSLPPAYVVGADGKRWHSWRALLLPFLEVPEVANKYRFDEPWDGPNNRLLWDQCPEMFRCPASDLQTTKTHFLAVVGPQTFWAIDRVDRMQGVKDRVSKTVTVIEVKDGVPWLAPVDLAAEDAISLWTNDETVSKSHHANGRNVLMADGTVQFLSPATLSRDEWESMLIQRTQDTKPESNAADEGR